MSCCIVSYFAKPRSPLPSSCVCVCVFACTVYAWYMYVCCVISLLCVTRRATHHAFIMYSRCLISPSHSPFPFFRPYHYTRTTARHGQSRIKSDDRTRSHPPTSCRTGREEKREKRKGADHIHPPLLPPPPPAVPFRSNGLSLPFSRTSSPLPATCLLPRVHPLRYGRYSCSGVHRRCSPALRPHPLAHPPALHPHPYPHPPARGRRSCSCGPCARSPRSPVV